MSEEAKKGLTRRSFIAGAGAAAAAVAATGLAGCSPSAGSSSSKSSSSTSSSSSNLSSDLYAGNNGTPSFLNAPDPIKDIAETKEYDVVVIGAGASGIPAALSAKEAGATVALLQKQDQAVSQGNSGTGIDLTKSDPAGVAALVEHLIYDSASRADRKLIQMWADYSGEAVKWVLDKAIAGGAPAANAIDQGNLQQKAIETVDGYGPMTYITSFFGPKPYHTGDGMKALANQAATEGVEIFYSTPAQQLVVGSDGAVTGVIGMDKDSKYIQFNAKKGVIVAAGDYENDDEMCNYYIPDLRFFERKESNKTGDGHKMIVWAGGKIEDINHTKMLHDFDAGPASMCDMPFLCVNKKGERFVCETGEMSLRSNFLRTEEDAGWYAQIFDSTYMDFASTWPGKLVDPEGLKMYEPEDTGEKKGVFKDFVRTYVRDNVEDLATCCKDFQMDKATFKKTIDRYNEIATAGVDTDFGVPAKYLHTIAQGPFYAIFRHVRVSTICSGVDVDENCQCLTPQGDKIKGLFAIGNDSGHFYGGVDYPLRVFGLSLGRCYTQGYVIGKYVAKL